MVGEPGEAEAVVQFGALAVEAVCRGASSSRCLPPLLSVVDEVAAGTIGAEADGVEGTAQLGLVLGVPGQTAQLMEPMGKLTLLTIFASATLLEGPAELRLVAGGVDLSTGLLLLLLLLEMQEVLATFSILTERAVPKLVLFIHQGSGVHHRFLEVVVVAELGGRVVVSQNL